MQKAWMASIVSVLAVTGWVSAACACSTPVFRYALERWAADPLPVVIFHKGPLATQEAKVVEYLRMAATDGKANLALELTDLDAPMHPQLKAMWDAQTDKTLPRMVLSYTFRHQMQTARPAEAPSTQPASPLSAVPPTLWSGPLTFVHAKLLVDSPARKEVAKRILDGETTVWVLLECGKKDLDDAAATTLTEQLARLTKELRLPDADPSDTPAAPAPPAAPGVSVPAQDAPKGPPIKIAFSIVRIPAAHPKEAVFVEMLLGLEKDLPEAHKTQPLAFPMYGRGRALNPLVGKGINANNIQEYCSALTAACSCEVKNENPGTDILMQADWEKPFAGAEVVPVELPVASMGGSAPEPAPQAAAQPTTAPGLSDSIARTPVAGGPEVAPTPEKALTADPVRPVSQPASEPAPAKVPANTWTNVVIITVLGVLVLTLFAAAMAIRKPRVR